MGTQIVGRYHLSSDINGTLTALVGAAAAVFTAFVAGLWQYVSGRKKGDVEGQSATIAGFIALISQLQTRILDLETLNRELEMNDRRQDRRIDKLERILRHNEIEVPENGP